MRIWQKMISYSIEHREMNNTNTYYVIPRTSIYQLHWQASSCPFESCKICHHSQSGKGIRPPHCVLRISDSHSGKICTYYLIALLEAMAVDEGLLPMCRFKYFHCPVSRLPLPSNIDTLSFPSFPSSLELEP